jgi:hypothetical protein
MSSTKLTKVSEHVRIPTRPGESGTGVVLERELDTSNGLDFVREPLALVGKTLFASSGKQAAALPGWSP